MVTDPSSLCYLCGKTLTRPLARDHVPPRQFYADGIRRRHMPNLLTIPVHLDCNHGFQRDEDYFVNTLAPFALGSYSGNALLDEIFRKYHAGEKRGLVHKMLKEFEKRPSGIILPPGQIVKRFNGERVHRVAWKIIRGLYFYNFRQVLPEDTPNRLEIFPPNEPPPREFFALQGGPVRGRDPGVFDYKFRKFPEVHNCNYWAMLFWDRLIMTMLFHDPSCNCAICAVTPGATKVDDL